MFNGSRHKGLDNTPKISAHFTTDEAKCKHCGQLPQELMPNITALAQKLELIRAKIGEPIIINSWFRCSDHNKAIGGKPNSAHLKGSAVDIATDSDSHRYKIVKFAYDCAFKRIEAKQNADGDSWTHLDIDPTLPQEVFII
jgi:hypothetical protein